MRVKDTSMSVKDWEVNDWSVAAVFTLIVVSVCFGFFSLYKTIAADGKVTHCYVEYYNQSQVTPPTYVVYGYRNWRHNIIIGIAPTNEQAETMMRSAAACPK